MSNDIDAVQAEVVANSHRWFPTLQKQDLMFKLMYHALGLGGESGEVEDNVKKLARVWIRLQGDDPSPIIDPEFESLIRDIKSELGDVFAYLCNIADLIDVSLVEAYREKAAFNETRDWKGGSG